MDNLKTWKSILNEYVALKMLFDNPTLKIALNEKDRKKFEAIEKRIIEQLEKGDKKVDKCGSRCYY